MACGTPAVAARAAALPEIGGDAARYFPPADSEAMTQVLRAVLADPPLQAQMRTEGLAQAARFSWARAAKETAQLYHQIL
jgi:glycosyltransferase involved in cell wall biosynthesis